MKITEVRIFPTESRDGKLKAFATMTFDDWFVVRNVKIIQGNNGLFVAMPSRKAMDLCPKCRFKNVRGARFCNQCGAQIEGKQIPLEETAGDKQAGHMDVAHPITQECRVYIQDRILDAYSKDKGEQVSSESKGKSATSTEKEKPAGAEDASREDHPAVSAHFSPADEAKDIEL